jgi:hypothetical protein
MTEIDDRELRGPVLDVYGDFKLARRQIGDVHPHALRFQGWPEGQADEVKAARRAWPDVLIGICPGVDPIARRWRSHRNVDRAVAELVGIADRTVALGVGHLVWDAEASWKATVRAERDTLGAIAARAVREVAEKYSGLRQYLTSYGWPVRVENVGGHGDFPWRGWLLGNVPEAGGVAGGVPFFGQTYDRGAGRLVDGERVALGSFDAMLRQQLAGPGTVRYAEIQTHHNDDAEIAVVGTSTDITCFWAAGTERLFDEEGERGWRTCLELWRRGYWGGRAVERFQAAAGLDVDGVAGPKTRAALGL